MAAGLREGSMQNEKAVFSIVADIQRRLLRLERADRGRVKPEESYTKRQSGRLRKHNEDAARVREAPRHWREKRRPVPLTKPEHLAGDAWYLVVVIAGLSGLAALLWFVF